MSPSTDRLFAKQSKAYAVFRPEYPADLYRLVVSHAPGRELAWDCATGTGQAARGIASSFARVVATDVSAEQVAQASGPSNVAFQVGTAESSGLADRSVDLITVAQAAHWFDHEAFHRECRRVLKSGGVLAIWGYGFFTVTPEIDAILDPYSREFLGPYWHERNQLIIREYRDLPFPFQRIATPKFALEVEWDFEQVQGYLSSWSATQKYRDSHGGIDPFTRIESDLAKAWGDPARKRQVRWPLPLLIGKA